MGVPLQKKRKLVVGTPLGGTAREADFGSVADVLANAETTGASSSGPSEKGLDAQFAKLFSARPVSATAGVKGKKRKRTEVALEAGAEAEAEAQAQSKGRGSASVAAAKSRRGRSGPLTEEERKEREQRLLFVGNVPLDWDAAKLRLAIREAVGEQYTGPIKPIWFRNEPIKEKYGKKNWKSGHILKDYIEGVSDAKIGFAELTSPDSVKIVRNAIHGYQAGPNHILRGDGVGENAVRQTFGKKNSVFVGNLPQDTSESDLRRALGPAGAVDAVRIVRDKEQKACKGIAFVRFSERSSVKAALNLWGVEIRGRQLRIMHVADQSEEGRVKKKQIGEMTPAARRILLKKQRRLRSDVKKAMQKRKEAQIAFGKKKGTRTNVRRTKGGKVKRKARR